MEQTAIGQSLLMQVKTLPTEIFFVDCLKYAIFAKNNCDVRLVIEKSFTPERAICQVVTKVTA